MKTGFRNALIAVIGVIAIQQVALAGEMPGALSTNKIDQISYSIGMNIGINLKRAGFDIDVNVMAQAIKDALAGNTKITEQEAQKIYTDYQVELRAKKEEQRIRLAAVNREQGQKFLSDNAKKPGVSIHAVALADGTSAEIQYKEVSPGTGEIPAPTDMASVNVRGTLLNGTEFENTANRGGPARVSVNRAFNRGLSEALALMKVGSKWMVYVPSSLAYGDNAGPPNVEPGSTLIYEIELVSAEPPPASPATSKPLTSDVIKVPSQDDLNKGAKIEVIKAEEAERMARSNSPAPPKPK